MRWIFRLFLYVNRFVKGPLQNCCSLFYFKIEIHTAVRNRKSTLRFQRRGELSVLQGVSDFPQHRYGGHLNFFHKTLCIVDTENCRLCASLIHSRQLRVSLIQGVDYKYPLLSNLKYIYKVTAILVIELCQFIYKKSKNASHWPYRSLCYLILL